MRVLVIGASANPARTSNQAIHMLRSYGHEVFAIGRKVDKVADVTIEEGTPAIKSIDTITLYVNPKVLVMYKDYIRQISPRRVIFNPGTEDEDFMTSLAQSGIQVEEACTLVLLRTNQFDVLT